MNQNKATALMELFDEMASLSHRLRAVSGGLHGDHVLSAARRDILRGLDSLGPSTVPQLARARRVSRQHIQALVKMLLRDRLAAIEENPAHRRSFLLRLTPQGKRLLEQMDKRERKLLANIPLHITSKELQRAGATLRALRESLEGNKWTRRAGGK